MIKKLLFILSFFIVIYACSKKEDLNIDDLTSIDSQLYKAAMDTTGYHYYIWAKGNTINTDNSPHKGYFRLRFNKQAWLSLDSFTLVMRKDISGKDSVVYKDIRGKDSMIISQYKGELNPGNKFKDSSIIVQELYTNQDDKTPVSISVMMKTSHENSKDGFIWGNYQMDKKILYSVKKAGQACAGCHNKGNNRDMVRTFESY